MLLTFEQIQAAARGVAYVSEEAGLIQLHRFTPEQENLYSHTSPEFYAKAFATAGVILEFTTDSNHLSLQVALRKGSSRLKFAHSIFVNDQPIGTLAGPVAPSEISYAEGNWDLGVGQKRVKIRFPWSANSMIRALELDDGASFIPVIKAKKVLVFGDSITQGYDAVLPEDSYASILADALNANCLDKAIGGEVFRTGLALLPDAGEIDLITVAYGTNDWFFKDAEAISRHAKAFYGNLRMLYPQTKIVVMAPVWRGDWQDIKPSGDFRHLAVLLREIAEKIGNALFVDCFDFIPHEPAYYAPDILHPNSDGFRHYGEALANAFRMENLI